NPPAMPFQLTGGVRLPTNAFPRLTMGSLSATASSRLDQMESYITLLWLWSDRETKLPALQSPQTTVRHLLRRSTPARPQTMIPISLIRTGSQLTGAPPLPLREIFM